MTRKTLVANALLDLLQESDHVTPKMIARRVGVSSTAEISYELKKLENAGFLVRLPHSWSHVQVIRGPNA